MTARLALPMPCSKVCDLNGDAETLGPFNLLVDQCSEALDGQHPIRRWEYAMALRTIMTWQDTQPSPTLRLSICDIGGAGSNFWRLLSTLTTDTVECVDPNTPDNLRGYLNGTQKVWFTKQTIEQYAADALYGPFDILTVVSVIEHVKDLRPFLRACRQLLRPGGLLFLTTDYWDAEGPDTAHFHWMRERIYNYESMRTFLTGTRAVGFRAFGSSCWTYHGAQVYDYAVASAALVKT